MGHHLHTTAPLCVPLPARRSVIRQQWQGAHTWDREVLAQTAAWRCAFSSQRVAVQRSLISQSSSKSGVTKPLPSGQYARGLFDLLFVHDFYSSPSRGTRCPVEESPPSWDTAQTLGGWSSAHMFPDSKFAKEKCVSLPTVCCAGALTAALQVPVIAGEEGLTENRSPHLGYIMQNSHLKVDMSQRWMLKFQILAVLWSCDH